MGNATPGSIALSASNHQMRGDVMYNVKIIESFRCSTCNGGPRLMISRTKIPKLYCNIPFKMF